MLSTHQLLQVYEHQTIRIKEMVNGVVFTKSMWESLAYYHEKHHGKYYRLTYKGVQFKQYVGIIQIGGLVIEILPKIDQQIDSTATWQRVLIELLQYCQLLKIDTLGVGQVQITPHAILDLFFNQYLEELKKIVQAGLLRKYIPKEQNNHQLKGQLVLPKHLRYNYGKPERFYTKQQSFEETHLLNHLLYEALKVLQKLPLTSSLQSKVAQVYRQFPPLPSYQCNAQDFEKLLHYSEYRPYHSTIELARLILLNFSADIRYGKHHLFALLFDMNALFEEYIFQQLKQAVGPILKISRQRSIPFWRRRMIRPDIVLEINQEKYIIDTKWKLLPNASPSIEDLKQLYIYCRYFKSSKGILLYPLANAQKTTAPLPFLDEAKDIDCQLLFVNILEEDGQLKKGIGKEILENIMENGEFTRR